MTEGGGVCEAFRDTTKSLRETKCNFHNTLHKFQNAIKVYIFVFVEEFLLVKEVNLN